MMPAPQMQQQQPGGNQVPQMVVPNTPPGHPSGPPSNPPPPPPPQQQPGQQQGQDPKLDNISKVKTLAGPLKDSLANVLKTAAQNFLHNYNIDAGSLKGGDSSPNRFDKSLEEFYSICDQMELHMSTAMKCIQQGQSSQRYLPVPVALCRPDNPMMQDTLSYAQYVSTVKSQVAFTKEIHDSLLETVHGISPGD